MGCLFISYPSTRPGIGFGSGGAGGGSSFLPLGSEITAGGVQAVAQFSPLILNTLGPRTFFIAGIDQVTIASAMLMFPTSEDLSAAEYVIGSSQFYRVGEVIWNGAVQTEGAAWELVAPFNHVVRILINPATINTSVRFIYFAWDIGARTGFEVTSYPVPFSFIGTRILAERVPPPNQFFTVNYTIPRRGGNPTTMFARYPMLIDDFLDTHTLYDGDSGFETYRPAGYRVFDVELQQVFIWEGTQWGPGTTLSVGTKFYVKRTRTIYHFDGISANVVYIAGDSLTLAVPEALAYPVSPVPTELFGESIGKNLLQDAFSSEAAIQFPSAYMISQRPGDYDEWIADEFG